MSDDKDLFAEEQSMVTMSFGEHIEELRVRLILALLGLFVGVLIVFVPPLNIGWQVMKKMEQPAKVALDEFYTAEYKKKAEKAEAEKAAGRGFSPRLEGVVEADGLIAELRKIAPKLELPEPESLKGTTLKLSMQFFEAGVIEMNKGTIVQIDQSLVSLAPLETLTIFFMVCLVSGLVLASPWVFYQIWAFVAAGLYRHERHYVTKYLPFSLGLFLAGVFLCFFLVLAHHPQVPVAVQRLAGCSPHATTERLDGVRDDPAPRFWRIVPDAARDVVSRANQHLHGAGFPGEAQDRDPGHHDHGRRDHAGAGPIQHGAAGNPDDPAL